MIVRLLAAVIIPFLMLSPTQQSAAQEMPDSAAQAEMMAKVMELAQPGEEHALLEKLVGDWVLETKMWMSPGAEPMFLSGISSAKMVLDGRFLYGEFTSDADPMPGEGIYIIGFDRRHEKYIYVGFDTWGTYSMSATGTYDDATQSITLYGEDDDPVIGQTQKYEFVISFISDDVWRFDVIFLDEFHTQGGGPFKMGEITYTRAK